MKRLCYQGRPGSLLDEGGTKYGHGELLEVPDERAAQLLADPSVPVTLDLTHLKRDELDRLARQAGVQEPENLPNKGSVIEALTEPSPPPIAPGLEPIAGQAQTDHQEDH